MEGSRSVPHALPSRKKSPGAGQPIDRGRCGSWPDQRQGPVPRTSRWSAEILLPRGGVALILRGPTIPANNLAHRVSDPRKGGDVWPTGRSYLRNSRETVHLTAAETKIAKAVAGRPDLLTLRGLSPTGNRRLCTAHGFIITTNALRPEVPPLRAVTSQAMNDHVCGGRAAPYSPCYAARGPESG